MTSARARRVTRPPSRAREMRRRDRVRSPPFFFPVQCVKTVVALFSREEFFLKLVLSFLGTGRMDGRRRRARTRRDARGAARPRPRPRRRDRSTRADTPAGTTRGDEGGGTSSTVPSAARRNERRRFASRVALVGFFRSLRQLSTTVSGRIQRNPQADPQPFSPPKSSIKISQTLAFWRDRARFNWPFEGKSRLGEWGS